MTAATEWAERTAQAQGLPPKISDPAALARVAQIIATSRDSAGTRKGPRP